MIPELRDFSYEERLTECGLTTLETRRLRGDQTEIVKILYQTVNEWNTLSTDCVTASSVNMFQNKLDTYLRRAGYT